MSDSFKSYFTNKLFTKAYGFRNNSNGIIYIENEKDTDFWRKILKKAGLENYQFGYSSKSKDSDSRGKAGLRKLFETLNQNALIGIDGDYEYITHNKNNVAESCIVKNEFILHTFSYSRESVYLNSLCLNESISKIYFSEPIEFCFFALLKELSNKVYNDLVTLLYFYENNEITEGNIKESFSKIKIIDSPDSFYQISYDDDYTKSIVNHATIFDFEAIKEKYRSLGLTSDTAYRFLDGHKVESLINEVVRKERSKLIVIEQNKIKEENKGNGKLISDRIKELNNHLETRCSFLSILNNQPLDHDEIYVKIVDKATEIKRKEGHL